PHRHLPSLPTRRSSDLAIAESNAFAMHASAIAARPAVIYWLPATLAVLAELRGLRSSGRTAWATIDAGPHVKVLTTDADAELISDRKSTRLNSSHVKIS